MGQRSPRRGDRELLRQGRFLRLDPRRDRRQRAQGTGASEADLKSAAALHRKAQWRLDFVAAENSMGFHAPQELARILGEAIDSARQGQLEAEREAKKK
ncbi:MAG TPA: ammonia-forming cytochrome c nitrite reductase subunit c552 [Terriglobales bacterium]|nr:ammonia-forming cytochrome c nitrite reductase subunit c552 [Terriglobales bacterium]